MPTTSPLRMSNTAIWTPALACTLDAVLLRCFCTHLHSPDIPPSLLLKESGLRPGWLPLASHVTVIDALGTRATFYSALHKPGYGYRPTRSSTEYSLVAVTANWSNVPIVILLF